MTPIEYVVVISLFVVAIVIAILFIYLYIHKHHNEYPIDRSHRTISIENKRSYPVTVTTPDSVKHHLLPSEMKTVSTANHSTLKFHTQTDDDSSSVNEYQYTLSNPYTNMLYVTNDGVRSNLSVSHDVTLVNMAPYAIYFVLVSGSGKRWEIAFLEPYSSRYGAFIPHGVKIEVVQSDLKNNPISEITVAKNVSQIIFNGDHILSV
jgi:hypothetical protein